MPRTRAYNRQEVLQNAVDVFWSNGYRATSIAEIVAATGLNTASMYKEFRDKDGLFEAALEYYRDQIMAERIRLLSESQDWAGVLQFLNGVGAGAARRTYRGCLMMNHLAQKHLVSKKAARLIGEFCETMEGLLETALRNAQKSGDVPADRDPATLASYVMCCVHGLVLYGRHDRRKDQIPAIRDQMIRVLKG